MCIWRIEIHDKNQQISLTSRFCSLIKSVNLGCCWHFYRLFSAFCMHQLPLWVSVSYWVFTCVLGFFIYTIYCASETVFANQIRSEWIKVSIGAVLAAVMSFAIPITNWLFFSDTLLLWQQFPPFSGDYWWCYFAISFLREHRKIRKRNLLPLNARWKR